MKKPMTGAERAAKNYWKNVNAGLIQIKVWVHPTEAKHIKALAKGLIKTKAAIEARDS